MTVTARAPGRVNLIGDHTDYTGGLVLPMAIDRWTTVTGERGGEEVRLTSVVEGAPVDVPDALVAAVQAETGCRGGFVGSVTTTIPVGSGLSSSAALEAALALAFGADDDGDADRTVLATALQAAEQRAFGVPCGVMDQLVSLLGVDGHALLIDCSCFAIAPVALPEGIAVVVIDSRVRRTLATVPYAERGAEVRGAAALLDAGQAPEAVADPILRRRARHLVSENARVRAMADALSAGDAATAGAILSEGHRSLRDDLETSTAAIDELVDAVAARPGVHGARLTGGGWGGMVVALAEPGALEGIGEEVHAVAGASVTIGPATSG